jgi:iron complex transport system ATP-binding protein
MTLDDEPMLRAVDLTLGYPKAEAVVKRVSIELRKGRVFSIAGPNGAGKSTLLAALAGIAKPKSGRVLFMGRNLFDLKRRERARQVGFLPQTVRPSIPYTVGEIVHLGRYAHGTGLAFETLDDRDAVERALAQTSTSHLADRLFSELSGGERQRVLIASVLAGEPLVLLLDEPTASLDISGSIGVFETLRQSAKEGRTVGVVTHDLNLAGQFSDDMVLMAEGNIIASGEPQTVLNRSSLEKAYGGGFLLVERPDSPVPAVLPKRKKEAPWRQ